MKRKPKTTGKYQPNSLVSSLANPHPSGTDPMGTWTGMPEQEMGTPAQDADDL